MKDSTIRKVMQELGKRGGKNRAELYSKTQLKKWGKLGGRPVGAKDSKPRKRTKKGG
jgi:hypothetical protein